MNETVTMVARDEDELKACFDDIASRFPVSFKDADYRFNRVFIVCERILEKNPHMNYEDVIEWVDYIKKWKDHGLVRFHIDDKSIQFSIS